MKKSIVALVLLFWLSSPVHACETALLGNERNPLSLSSYAQAYIKLVEYYRQKRGLNDGLNLVAKIISSQGTMNPFPFSLSDSLTYSLATATAIVTPNISVDDWNTIKATLSVAHADWTKALKNQQEAHIDTKPVLHPKFIGKPLDVGGRIKGAIAWHEIDNIPTLAFVASELGSRHWLTSVQLKGGKFRAGEPMEMDQDLATVFWMESEGRPYLVGQGFHDNQIHIFEYRKRKWFPVDIPEEIKKNVILAGGPLHLNGQNFLVTGYPVIDGRKLAVYRIVNGEFVEWISTRLSDLHYDSDGYISIQGLAIASNGDHSYIFGSSSRRVFIYEILDDRLELKIEPEIIKKDSETVINEGPFAAWRDGKLVGTITTNDDRFKVVAYDPKTDQFQQSGYRHLGAEGTPAGNPIWLPSPMRAMVGLNNELGNTGEIILYEYEWDNNQLKSHPKFKFAGDTIFYPPNWLTHDGRTVGSIGTREGHLFFLELSENRIHTLERLDIGKSSSATAWYRDGDQVYVAIGDYNGNLHLIELMGGTP